MDKQRQPKAPVITLFILLSIILLAVMIVFFQHNNEANQQALYVVQQKTKPTTTNRLIIHSLPWETIIIRKGDSLAHIFAAKHIFYKDLKNLLSSKLAKKILAHIQPGQALQLQIKKRQLQKLKYSIDADKTLYVERIHDLFSAKVTTRSLTDGMQFKSGVIRTSLADATRRAGLTHKMYQQLITIFKGELNFQWLRPGDRFSVLYREYYYQGKKYRPGNIIAAEFTHRGKTYQAIRFAYPKNHIGYYSPNGSNLLPSFLKQPLKYKRISSYFSIHRLDPYLHKVHPHLGIDYAAARGTPIKSISNGIILSRGRRSGYGNAVIIKYSKKYRVLYGHMERFAKNMHVNDYVHKGQVIGYVGSTGWATGPHLHFEIYVNGVPHDPLKMKLPTGKAVPKSYEKAFQKHARMLLAELKLFQGPRFAENNTKIHHKE